MYWTPKMRRDPICAHFIVTSKKCWKILILKAVSKVFQQIIRQIQNFYVNHISIIH